MTDPDTPAEPSVEVSEVEVAKAANRFDIRRLIGGLFILYSLILIVLGVAGSHHIKTKAAGINVNLWTGLAMLVFGVLMVAWALWRPTVPKPERPEEGGPYAARAS
ncbi:MAG: hypothetical protein WAL22_19725 [Solirubrobacteraceae bacterium]